MRSVPSECNDGAHAKEGHFPKPEQGRKPCAACRQSAMTGLTPKEVNPPSQNRNYGHAQLAVRVQ